MSTLWRGTSAVVLASASVTRRRLLEAVGIPVESHPSRIDERQLEQMSALRAASHDDLALALAAAKGRQVATNMPDRLVLGADQLLTLEQTRLHKPASRAEAVQQLLTLSGKTHRLHSACVLWHEGAVLFQTVATARMTMRHFDEKFASAFVEACDPAVLASIGIYQIEGLGAHLFERVEGDHATILGLPLYPLLKHFRQAALVAA